MWQSLRRSILESLYINTSPFRKKTVSQSGQYAESKKELPRYFYILVCMKSGGLTWNVAAIIEKFKTSLFRTANLSNERRFGEPFLWSNYSLYIDGWLSPSFFERPVNTSPVRLKRSYQASSLVMCCNPAGIWTGDILVADVENQEKSDASEIHAWRPNAEEVPSPQRREEFAFLFAVGLVKLTRLDRPILKFLERLCCADENLHDKILLSDGFWSRSLALRSTAVENLTHRIGFVVVERFLKIDDDLGVSTCWGTTKILCLSTMQLHFRRHFLRPFLVGCS